jgi:hypothetical protein
MARFSSGISRSLVFSRKQYLTLSHRRLIESVGDSLRTLICPVETEQNRSLLGALMKSYGCPNIFLYRGYRLSTWNFLARIIPLIEAPPQSAQDPS